MRLVRVAGDLKVSLDGQVVYEAPFDADIRNIVIFSVRHRNPTEFEFGTFWLGELSVCFPGVQWSPTVACSDGNPCNGTETCDGAGNCAAGAPPSTVDDGNPCTEDNCSPETGVTHVPLDGTICAAGDACQGVPPNICRSGQCLANHFLIPFGATSLRYLVYPFGTVPTNYWQTAFDDSAYSLGDAPFGSGGGCTTYRGSYRGGRSSGWRLRGRS